MKEGSQNLLYSRVVMSQGLLAPRPFLNVLFLAPRPAGHSLQPTTGERIKVAVPSILACHQGHMCPLYVVVSNPFTLSAQPIRTIITISVDFLWKCQHSSAIICNSHNISTKGISFLLQIRKRKLRGLHSLPRWYSKDVLSESKNEQTKVLLILVLYFSLLFPTNTGKIRWRKEAHWFLSQESRE